MFILGTIIDSMTGISIKSPFLENQNYELYPIHSKVIKNSNAPQKNRVALIYGKNGSGKSTIAQGFREYASSIYPRTVDLYPTAENLTLKINTQSRPEKFFVFDENYINEKIKIQQSGLGAIVLFGEQVELEQRIQETQQALIDAKLEVEKQQNECDKYSIETNINSPIYWINTITRELQKDGGWAEIAGIKIKKNQIKSRVTEKEIDRLGSLKPSDNENTTKQKFNEMFLLFDSTTSDSKPIDLIVPQISEYIGIETKTSSILNEVPKILSLTKREEELLDFFGIKAIESAKGFLSVASNKVCPTCLQKISEDYRKNTLREVENILNRDIKDFRKRLQTLMLPEIQIDNYQIYKNLDSQLYLNIYEKIIDINNIIKTHNDIIQTKIENPMGVASYDSSVQISCVIHELNNLLTKLETKRISFNKMISARKKSEETLLKLNDYLAYFQIRESYSSLIKQRKEKQTANEILSQLKTKVNQLNNNYQELNAQRKNFHIAIKEINKSLEYIFYSSGRLEVELASDQCYHLKSYGQPVSPEKISCGERNALAFCYFFTEISKNMEVQNLYKSEMFLVIDDPISSFDIENRVGMLSFLRFKLDQVLISCSTTKVLIMTHDISVLFDMTKALEEISRHCAQKRKNAEFNLFKLQNKQLEIFKYRMHNDYSELLNRVYQFAMNPTSEDELTIGNTIRRVLEAYASFLFKKGIEEISLDEEILQLLPDEPSRQYFRNSMYRLVLNTESHFHEAIQSAPETTFFGHLSIAEKQRTAKDILCFMYKINSVHILSHLPDAKTNLDTWWKNIVAIMN